MKNKPIYASCLSENTFNYFYDLLYVKASDENQAMYERYLSECRKKKRKPKSGAFVSEWQKIFNGWLENKIAHPLIVSVSEQMYVAEGMSEILIEQTKEL